MKFLVDAHLPPLLAAWIRGQGQEAEHVEDVGLRHADDRLILGHALATGAVLITKDRDFVDDAPPLRLVWVRTGNVSNRVLLARFEAGWASTVAVLSGGAHVVELN